MRSIPSLLLFSSVLCGLRVEFAGPTSISPAPSGKLSRGLPFLIVKEKHI